MAESLSACLSWVVFFCFILSNINSTMGGFQGSYQAWFHLGKLYSPSSKKMLNLHSEKGQPGSLLPRFCTAGNLQDLLEMWIV